MTFSLTGSSSNNAVGYEKHHHKHLGWHTFSATLSYHIKSQRRLHLYLSSEQSLMSFFSCCICSQISLTWATTMTQPQTLAHLCSIRSHHTWTRIRSDLFTRPTVSTSSLKAPSCSLSLEVPWKTSLTYLQYTAKEISASSFFFVPLPGVCKRMEQRVLMVNESRVCTKAAYQVSQKDSLQPPASL